ncbi:MAG TPA: hypothetical protein VFP27_19735 [Mycobacterium sp.]|nr:hypothetical protein [Mycobacterium sp.]
MTISTAAILKLRTGAAPANCGTADSGTVLCSMTLPSDWLAAAASGAKAKAGTWSGTASGGGGTIAHFRIYDSGGSVCHIQGTVGLGSGDLSLDNNVVADGQTVTVTAFTLTDGNA